MTPPGERAFTNPFSNAVVLSRFNLGEGLDTMARMQLPIRCLPQFLHETMHHWCFDSPVGVALTLLQMRARRRAISAHFSQIDETARNLVAQDSARVSLFLEFMRPILEGMALFSEHDLSVGSSQIVGRPAFLTGVMFSGRTNTPERFYENAAAVIGAGRLSQAHIRRKADLLLQPFTGTAEGYLAGYLNIKLLYRITLERCTAYIGDSDLFLHAFRSWLFDDWELVHILLDGTTDYEEWAVNRLLPYCQKRLAAFVNVSPSEIAAFEKRGARDQPDTFEYKGSHLQLTINSHPVIADSWPDAKRKLGLLLDELFGKWPDSPQMQLMFRTDMDILSLRGTLTLGHGLFDATISSGKMLQLRLEGNRLPIPLFATGAPENLTPGWSKKVEVELLLSTAPVGIYQVISDGTAVVAVHSFSFLQHEENHPEFLKTPLVNWEKRGAIMELWDEALDQVLKNSVEQGILDATIARVARTRDSIFELKGLLLTPNELIHQAQELLRTDGILKVLDGRLDLVLDAAALSLCAALQLKASSALPEWKWSEGTEQATIGLINEKFQAKLKFRPLVVVEKGDVIHSLI